MYFPDDEDFRSYEAAGAEPYRSWPDDGSDYEEHDEEEHDEDEGQVDYREDQHLEAEWEDRFEAPEWGE